MKKRLLFNQTMTADLLGISVQAFTKWNLAPAERRKRDVLYSWPDVLAERDRRYHPAVDVDGEPDQLDLDQERARHAKEQADKLALENAVSRNELTYTADVAEVFGRSVTAFRAKLIGIPNKLGARLPLAIRAATVARLSEMIFEALEEMANFDPGAAPTDNNHRSTDGASRAKSNGASKRRQKQSEKGRKR
jgi:phage terminase Nu1 subunit (DNA packaging protein)